MTSGLTRHVQTVCVTDRGNTGKGKGDVEYLIDSRQKFKKGGM